MKNLEDGPLPMYLKAFIEQDRRLLENELQERILLKQTKHKEQASLKSKMKGIYEKLPFQLEENVVENGDPDESSSSSKKSFEFIPMEWLIQYFSNPNRVTPIGKYSTLMTVLNTRWRFDNNAQDQETRILLTRTPFILTRFLTENYKFQFWFVWH